ncbi:MAG: hemolysin D [Clostridia bacterium BRH_c25]|nr:MAG: hemolysin D [Clostridia bacterium BRH_c25]
MTKIIVRKDFSNEEEIANAVTHGLGVLLGITALVIFAVKGAKTQNALYTVSMMIYSVSTIVLYANSMLYHAFKEGKTKNVFERLDHLSIYILIAGSYTPFCLIAIGGIKGIIICSIQWALAIAGVTFKVIWIDRFVKIHVLIYLTMGWMISFFISSIFKSISFTGFYLLLAGGIAYSAGVLFYIFNWFKYHHFVWHVFVLAGSVLIFFSLYLFVKI